MDEIDESIKAFVNSARNLIDSTPAYRQGSNSTRLERDLDKLSQIRQRESDVPFRFKRPTDVIDLTSDSENDSNHSLFKKPRSESYETPPLLSTPSIIESHSPPPKPSTPSQTFHSVQIPSRLPPRRPEIKPSHPTAIAQREKFLRNLSELNGPPITVVNEIDETSPPTDFIFLQQSTLGDGVELMPEEVMIGCECYQDSREAGCEYLHCRCLQDAAEKDGKKFFPYRSRGIKGDQKQCLRPLMLESRWHIYECNKLCSCGPNCKNRVVQHGRQVQLQIFKTTNRGWGLRCPIDLKKGQFIDTYRGEIITHKELEERAKSRNVDDENYFFDLDKFLENETFGQQEFCEYTCDGMHMGGPTRFINHSCDPNCRLFTVSYNHNDQTLYDLAFFALEDIPAGIELTFDYKDEDDRSVITEEKANEIERKDDYRPQKCLCNSASCRGYFFN